jgi:hypothetical protein
MEFDTEIELAHEASQEVDFDLSALLASDGRVEQDDMFDLNNLLNESLNRKKEMGEVKAARRKLASGGADGEEEKEALAELIRSWELRREWTPVANTIMFEVQHCTHCGAEHKHLTGLFQRQEHRTSKISRWVRAAEDVALPKTQKDNVSYIAICADCCEALGWGA